jgi:Glyoxalase superfamily protein
MRDFRDAKAMAQTLRDELKAKGVSLTHGDNLERVAKVIGFHDWNTLAAKIQSETRRLSPRRGRRSEPLLSLPFQLELVCPPYRCGTSCSSRIRSYRFSSAARRQGAPWTMRGQGTSASLPSRSGAPPTMRPPEMPSINWRHREHDGSVPITPLTADRLPPPNGGEGAEAGQIAIPILRGVGSPHGSAPRYFGRSMVGRPFR